MQHIKAIVATTSF